MNPYFEGIAARVVGEYVPISVATAIAIENACGINPETRLKKNPIEGVDQFHINIRTLFRNFMGALDTATLRGVPPVFIAPVIIEEMDYIESIVRDYSSGGTKVVFYFSNYKNLEWKYPKAVIRRDNTDKQKAYRVTMNDTMATLFDTVPERIKGYDLKLGDKDTHLAHALMLTNYAYDLLSYREFRDLKLIESHTGAVKERAQWYTKYHNGKELVMIPFREDLIQVFGDSETFVPMDLKLRKLIIDLAVTNRWGPLTTMSKIKDNLRQLKQTNGYATAIVESLLVGP